MSLINKAPRVSGLCLALMLVAGCESLNITNPNSPDRLRALADPASVQSIAVGAMQTWYNTFERIDPGTTLSVMARSAVAAWNNFNIRFYTGCTLGAWGPYSAPLGSCGTTNATYPRIEWQNSSASGQRLEIEYYWYGYYTALASANAVLGAIRLQHVVITDALTTKRVETMAVLAQALSLGELALNYDKGFVVDYNSDLATLQFAGRTAMRNAALAKYDEAIALANANAFTGDPAFFGPLPNAEVYNHVKIAQIANTMAARTLAYFPRNAAENATVDWARVAGYAANGISSTTGSNTKFDWMFDGDGCNNWCDGLKLWSNDMTTMRVHTRVAHLMDPTTQPDPFNSAGNSQPVWNTTSFDKRLGDGSFGPVGTVDTATSETMKGTVNAGTDFAWSYDKEIQFTARGLWHQSALGNVRYIKVTQSPMQPDGLNAGVGPAPVVLAAENDLLQAEALIRSGGSFATAAALIDSTRVKRGGLTALTGGETQAQLLTALQYEQDVELFNSNVAAFYNQRRIDNFEPLTPHELPVPAKELGVLQVPAYTWGGSSNPLNSAPTAPPPAMASVVNAPQIWAQIQQEQRSRVLANRLLNRLVH